ncbi:MAG: type II toxin-antitoxin system HicA family toxin [Bacillota bacterium]
MGSKYPILPPDRIIKVLKKYGFYMVSQKGSHVKYRKDGKPARVVIIPMHNEVAKGTLQSILEQADITLEEFLKNL